MIDVNHGKPVELATDLGVIHPSPEGATVLPIFPSHAFFFSTGSSPEVDRATITGTFEETSTGKPDERTDSQPAGRPRNNRGLGSGTIGAAGYKVFVGKLGFSGACLNGGNSSRWTCRPPRGRQHLPCTSSSACSKVTGSKARCGGRNPVETIIADTVMWYRGMRYCLQYGPAVRNSRLRWHGIGQPRGKGLGRLPWFLRSLSVQSPRSGGLRVSALLGEVPGCFHGGRDGTIWDEVGGTAVERTTRARHL